jgi:hypothetical protein
MKASKYLLVAGSALIAFAANYGLATATSASAVLDEEIVCEKCEPQEVDAGTTGTATDTDPNLVVGVSLDTHPRTWGKCLHDARDGCEQHRPCQVTFHVTAVNQGMLPGLPVSAEVRSGSDTSVSTQHKTGFTGVKYDMSDTFKLIVQTDCNTLIGGMSHSIVVTVNGVTYTRYAKCLDCDVMEDE